MDVSFPEKWGCLRFPKSIAFASDEHDVKSIPNANSYGMFSYFPREEETTVSGTTEILNSMNAVVVSYGWEATTNICLQLSHVDASMALIYGDDASIGSVCSVAKSKILSPPDIDGTSTPTASPTNTTVSPTASPTNRPTYSNPVIDMPGTCCLDTGREIGSSHFGQKVSMILSSSTQSCVQQVPL